MSDEQSATNMTADEVEQTIAAHLGESEAEPLQLLHKVVKKLGLEQALAFLKETQEIEAQGGLLLPDGSRRRTPGGVFLSLLPEEDAHWLRGLGANQIKKNAA